MRRDGWEGEAARDAPRPVGHLLRRDRGILGKTHTLSRKTPVSSRPSLIVDMTDIAPFRWPSTIFVDPSLTNYNLSQYSVPNPQAAVPP